MAVETTNISARTHPTVARGYVPVCRRNNCHHNDGTKFHWNVTGMAWAPSRALSGNL